MYAPATPAQKRTVGSDFFLIKDAVASRVSGGGIIHAVQSVSWTARLFSLGLGLPRLKTEAAESKTATHASQHIYCVLQQKTIDMQIIREIP